MTILVVDAGNTRIKWAIFAAGVLDHAGQTERPTPDRLHKCGEQPPPASLPSAALVLPCTAQDAQELPHSTDYFQPFAAQHWTPLIRPERVVVANVAGKDFGETLAGWVKQAWDIETEFVTPQRSACGIHNAYLDPEKLGVDRWASMIAAHRNVKGSVCVISCGTAITLDVLTASGEHQGGLIVPGLTLMRRALLENTQDIRNKMGDAMSDASGETAILACDTQGGVNGGTLYTVISVIDRVTTDLAAELGKSMTRIITGGDAPALLPLLAGPYRHEPLLVLQGLAIVAQAVPSFVPPAAPVLPGTSQDTEELPFSGTTVAPGVMPPATLVHPCTTENGE